MERKNTLAIASKIYQIIVTQEKAQTFTHSIQTHKDEQSNQKEITTVEQRLRRIEDELKNLRACLHKEKELTYIMKGYFAKIEKIMYNKESHLFQGDLDYQKVELHMREIVRRLTDFHNQKLNSLPNIYRNTNVKVYRHPPTTSHK